MNPYDEDEYEEDEFDELEERCYGAQPNVGDNARVLSLIGGGALLLYGGSKLFRKKWLGVLPVAAGGALVARGATGFCFVNQALGVGGKGTARPNIGNHGFLSRSVPGHGGTLVEKTVVINRPREELFAFWRKLENLPSVMSHLESVQEHGEVSHWVAQAPAGQSVEWTAEIVKETPNELIAWRSLPGAQVPNSGSVRFKDLPAGRGTEVRVILEYSPPAGKLGALVAKLFLQEPQIQVEEDLRKWKQVMEAGETATIEGQPRG